MRKYLIYTLIAFTLLFGLECVIANRQTLSLVLSGQPEKNISISSGKLKGNVKKVKSGIQVNGSGSITFENVDAESSYITLTVSGGEKIGTVVIKKTDQGSAINKNTAGSFRIYPNEGEHTFFVSSDGKLDALEISFDNSAKYTVSKITLNKRTAFYFNLARYLILCAAVAFIIAVYVFELYRIPYSRISGKKLGIYIAAVFCCFFTLLSSVKDVGFDEYPFVQPTNKYDTYAQLFDAFMKDRLDLDIEFDEDKLAELENPYDYYERKEAVIRGGIWDKAYYKGKLYCYFGVAPVLLIYFPIYFLTGMIPKAGTVSMILTLAACGALLFLLDASIKRFKLNPPRILVEISGVVLCSGSLLFVLNAHPSMYYSAMLSGILFLALTLGFAFKAYDASSAVKRYVFLGLTGLSAVLTVASRPTFLLYAVAIVPIMWNMVFGKNRKIKQKLINLACVGTPLLIGAVLIMAYNYARFESPFDFGNNYQLTFNDISYNSLELSRFFPSIYQYFLQAPKFGGKFPYVDLNPVNLELYGGYTYTYGSVGILTFPAALGIFGISAVDSDKKKKHSYISLVLVAVLIAFMDLCLAGVHIRYLADIAMPVMLVGILVILEIAQKCERLGAKIQRYAFTAAFVIFVVTVLYATAFLFQNEADNLYKNYPDVFMFFENLFK